MLAICEADGQLTGATTGLGVEAATGLAAGLAAGLGLGFGATGTVTVLVMVWVVVEPGDELEDPTQTVTEPDPIFEPCAKPELDDPELEQALAIWVSNPTKAAATKILAKPKLAC